MNVKNELLNLNKNNIVIKTKPMNQPKPTIIGKPLMGPPTTSNKYYTPAVQTKTTNSVVPSSSRSKSSVPSESQVILSICEGRGNDRCIVGLAAINIHFPVLILCQIPDGQTYTNTLTKLNILRPIEILVPNTFVENATPNRLFSIISEKYPLAAVQTIARNEFNRNRGLQYISNMCADNFSSVKLIIHNKFYAASATCALIRYIEKMKQINYTPRSIKIEYQETENTTMVDIDTANLLNLVSAYKKSGKYMVKKSLVGIIDKCVTNVGRRLLRQNVLQPPCRSIEIEIRHDCVSELIENSQLLTRLRDTLIPLQNIENSLTYGTLVPAAATSVSERQLTYTLQLKMHLIAIQPLAQQLKNTKHPNFRCIYERLIASDKYSLILQLIADVLNDEAQLAKGQAGEIQRCFAIKSGINGFLDIARKLYTEIVDNMQSYVNNLAQEYNLPLRAQHTCKMGFHIILPLTNATKNMKTSELPDAFYKIERYSKHFAMTTIEMISFGKQLKNTSTEIQSIGNVLIYKLLMDIRPFIGDLYQLCDDIALLDMLVSFALISSSPGYIRPDLSTTHMFIKEFKHPMLEYTLKTRDPVHNSVCVIPQSNIHIITGPNMSGKTIYVRALCIIQILSQLGCRVPAEKAIIRPCDRLYAQLANVMTLECGGMSSFTVEMNKFAYLLQTMSDKSFIILDELCKTTNCDEGFSIAFAICEELAQRKAFAFIVTHYLSLGVLAELYPNVTNWQFDVLENLRAGTKRISLKYTHKIIPGVTNIDAYGIKLARICTQSNSIVDRATELWKWMSPYGKTPQVVNETGTIDYLRKKLEADLNILKIKNELTSEIKQSKINEFKLLTGIEISDIESLDCITTITENNLEVASTASTFSRRNIFSISQTNNSVSNESNTDNIFSYNSEFSQNMCEQSSFHDPLNHILKSTSSKNNKRKFDDCSQETQENNNSVIYYSTETNSLNPAIGKTNEITVKKNCGTIIEKPLVSELYFSSSADSENSIISLSSTDDQNVSILSIDHKIFVENIKKDAITSTPIQKGLKLDESKNDFQIKNYEKFSNRHKKTINVDSEQLTFSFLQENKQINYNKDTESFEIISLISKKADSKARELSDSDATCSVNSGHNIFSDKSFKLHPKSNKIMKRNFKPPFKKKTHSESEVSSDIFNQDTLVQNYNS